MVKEFISTDADVDIKDHSGMTALMRVSSYGYTDVIKLLIEAGADVNAKDNDDMTALMYATQEGQTDIVNLLRAAETRQKL